MNLCNASHIWSSLKTGTKRIMHLEWRGTGWEPGSNGGRKCMGEERAEDRIPKGAGVGRNRK